MAGISNTLPPGPVMKNRPLSESISLLFLYILLIVIKERDNETWKD